LSEGCGYKTAASDGGVLGVFEGFEEILLALLWLEGITCFCFVWDIGISFVFLEKIKFWLYCLY
jgi:hypothetical protein